MSRFEAALLEMVALLDELGFPYMLIGGLAVAEWGEPRATLDVDLSIWVEAGAFDTAIAALASRMTLHALRPVEFARLSRVLPGEASNGIPVDLLLARWPFEKQAIDRAVERTVAGRPVRVVNLDDLLLLKLISERPKDLQDAAALLRRHRNSANVEWLEQEISALAESSAQPDMIERFRKMLEDLAK